MNPDNTQDHRSSLTYLGLPLTPLDAEQAAAAIAARPAGAPYGYVVTPNAQHYVRLAAGDCGFIIPYRHALMRLNDSQPARALARLLEGKSLPLASGADVTARLFRDHVRSEDPILVIGGDAAMIAALRQQFGLTDLTWHDPPMGFMQKPEAVEACLAAVRAHPARYILIATGAPQSERLALRLLEEAGLTGTGLCIGSSLLFLTGRVRRAPRWMRQAGLEWLYRLARNPFGHARRVFVDSLPLLWLALRNRNRSPIRLND
jgi:exopolysaccharide biosynthesis WecB/TagA/CpsF family protein